MHLLTHKLTHAVDEDEDEKAADQEESGPLDKLTCDREESKRLWEESNCTEGALAWQIWKITQLP